MPAQPVKREIAFTIMDVARLLKTYADQRARQFGMSRAQWAVLIRIERSEGLKQSELAEMLDLQPISLTRLLDRLADNGLIERRADPNDRRANRLYLTPAAQPLLEPPVGTRRRHDGDRARRPRRQVGRTHAQRARHAEGQSAPRHQRQSRNRKKPSTVDSS